MPTPILFSRSSPSRRIAPYGRLYSGSTHLFYLYGRAIAALPRWVWLLLSLSIAAAAGLTVAESRAGTPLQEAPSLELQIGGNSEFSPYEFTNARGAPDGFSVDLIEGVAREMNLKVNITLGPWQEIRRKLEDRRIDAVTGMLYSKERDAVFDFSVPHMIVSYAVFVRKGTGFKSIEDLKDKEVLVVANVYAHDWLLANAFTPHIFAVQRPEAALGQLSSGKHDFAVLPRLHGLDLLRKFKIENVETVGPPVLTQKFGFAVAAGNADLLAILNEGLLLVQKSGEYDRIYRKWFSVFEQKRQYVRYALRIGIPLLALVLAVLLWNFSLKKTLMVKTRKLRENEALLSQIIQGAPMPTFVIDQSHRVTHWNKACEDLTGIDARQITGTPNHASAFYHDERPAISDLLLDKKSVEEVYLPLGRQVRASSLVEGAWEAELFFSKMRPDGRWLYGTAALLRDAGGHVIGAIESWKDLTDHKKMEAQLIQSQKMEAVGTLASGISHDFNNILMAIMAISEMGRRKATRNEPVSDAFGDILDACEHASNLVRRILTFSRQSEMQVKPSRIDVLVNETLELIRATIPSSIQINRVIATDAWVAMDATQMQQVLMNLCTNAVHAMQETNGTLSIRLNAAGDEILGLGSEMAVARRAFVKLTVTDTGHGIPAEIVNRIFDPFFTTKKRGEGTGMGLSISHGIVKRFGGTITVGSRPGKGTTFNVFLPVIDNPASLSVETMPKGTERILIVSGNAKPNHINTQILQQLGYEIMVEPLEQPVLEEVHTRTGGADLIIAALGLSGSSPKAFVRTIKHAHPQLPIIMAMGFSADLEGIDAHQLEVDAIIKQPIVMHELAVLIRELLDRRPSLVVAGRD